MPKQNIKQEISILNIRLPRDILMWLDSTIDEGSYSSRSEMVRDILRDYVNEEENT